MLFGGEPWLIQCYSGLPYAGQHLPRPYRLHDVFTSSLGSMRSLSLRAAVVDCERPLPSNHTLVSKLGLVRRTQPLLVLAYGGNRPKQLPASAVGSAYAVTAFVKPKVEPTVHRVTSTQHLQASYPRPARDTPQAPRAVSARDLGEYLGYFL